MKLFGSSLSPYVRKVMIYAAEKGLEIEVKQIALGQPDPEFRATSPFGKIPGFQDGDFRISDSTAIITYLEAKHPEPSLVPVSPEDRARAVWFEEFADTIFVGVGGKIFFNRIVAGLMGREGDMAAADKAAAEELPPIYDYLETVVPPGESFLAGDRLSIADIAVAERGIAPRVTAEDAETALATGSEDARSASARLGTSTPVISTSGAGGSMLLTMLSSIDWRSVTGCARTTSPVIMMYRSCEYTSTPSLRRPLPILPRTQTCQPRPDRDRSV